MPRQRTTRQFNAIQAAIADAGRPLSIEEIHEIAREAVPTIGLRTIYRVVRQLQADEEIAAVDGIIVKLKTAKRHLKEKANDMALSEFDEALKEINANEGALAEAWKARRKAHRGRGAALERLGRYGEALEAMQTVLSLSVDHDDHSGETDALGVIADIYTDMDQLEIASEYYDRYFQSLQEEDALNAAKEAAEEKAVAR